MQITASKTPRVCKTWSESESDYALICVLFITYDCCTKNNNEPEDTAYIVSLKLWTVDVCVARCLLSLVMLGEHCTSNKFWFLLSRLLILKTSQRWRFMPMAIIITNYSPVLWFGAGAWFCKKNCVTHIILTQPMYAMAMGLPKGLNNCLAK